MISTVTHRYLGDRADEIFGRRRQLIGRVLTRDEPDIADAREPLVARVGKIALSRRQGAARELARVRSENPLLLQFFRIVIYCLAGFFLQMRRFDDPRILAVYL